MKIVILCGGMGTRLREETEMRPKPMINIGGHPILWHIMRIYAHYGFRDFILCLGYHGSKIKEYFYHHDILNNDCTISLGATKKLEIHNPNPQEDWQVTLVDTGNSALKGARIKKIEKYLDTDTFMVTYGDGVANVDINKLLSFYKKRGKIGVVTGVRPPSRFGELVVKGVKVKSFKEKPQVSGGLINGGFFVFNKKIFEYLTEDDECDFEKGALEQLARDDELSMYEHSGEWECMDTYRDMEYLNRLWQEGRAFWNVWDK
ncbi:MAG: glucose-1-phosphate cytidylyltransferase [Methanobacteriota archaeon]